jgi:hypothetical protein
MSLNEGGLCREEGEEEEELGAVSWLEPTLSKYRAAHLVYVSQLGRNFLTQF